MINLINKIFKQEPSKAETSVRGFSDFFTNTNSAEKKKIIGMVVRRANEDQKELVRKYNREFSKI